MDHVDSTWSGVSHMRNPAFRQADCVETCGVMWQRRNENINDFHSLLFTKSAHNLKREQIETLVKNTATAKRMQTTSELVN